MEKAKCNQQDGIVPNIISAIFLAIWIYLAFTEAPDMLWGTFGPIFIGASCAIIAAGKNRNPFCWFVAGIWFILLSALILLCLRSLSDRLCPYCQKGIANATTICPYCRKDVSIRQNMSVIKDTKETSPIEPYYG